MHYEMAQDETEMSALVALVEREGARSFLEIGSKYGGSLWRIGSVLPKGSRVVSVDLPNGTKAWTASEKSLRACVAALSEMGQDARIIWGNSTSADVVAEVAALGPYDVVLIDADHRLPGVTADWENYGALGRIIAFHDIAWRRAPEWQGVRIDVPQFWNSIKGEYRHEEFKFCPTRKNNGIGVLWRGEKRICEIDGVSYSYMPHDEAGQPAFVGDGGVNPEFDWRAWRAKVST